MPMKAAQRLLAECEEQALSLQQSAHAAGYWWADAADALTIRIAALRAALGMRTAPAQSNDDARKQDLRKRIQNYLRATFGPEYRCVCDDCNPREAD